MVLADVKHICGLQKLSQLRTCRWSTTKETSRLHHKLILERWLFFREVLERWLIPRNNEPVVQWLIHWMSLLPQREQHGKMLTSSERFFLIPSISHSVRQSPKQINSLSKQSATRIPVRRLPYIVASCISDAEAGSSFSPSCQQYNGAFFLFTYV